MGMIFVTIALLVIDLQIDGAQPIGDNIESAGNDFLN